jgi:hypothetical protein
MRIKHGSELRFERELIKAGYNYDELKCLLLEIYESLRHGSRHSLNKEPRSLALCEVLRLHGYTVDSSDTSYVHISLM